MPHSLTSTLSHDCYNHLMDAARVRAGRDNVAAGIRLLIDDTRSAHPNPHEMPKTPYPLHPATNRVNAPISPEHYRYMLAYSRAQFGRDNMSRGFYHLAEQHRKTHAPQRTLIGDADYVSVAPTHTDADPRGLEHLKDWHEANHQYIVKAPGPDGQTHWRWGGTRNARSCHPWDSATAQPLRDMLYRWAQMADPATLPRLPLGYEAVPNCGHPACIHPAHLKPADSPVENPDTRHNEALELRSPGNVTGGVRARIRELAHNPDRLLCNQEIIEITGFTRQVVESTLARKTEPLLDLDTLRVRAQFNTVGRKPAFELTLHPVLPAAPK